MTIDEIIEKLKEQARESWSGEGGETRANRLEKFIRAMLNEYSAVLGFSEIEILTELEKIRDYSAINYYQLANFPPLKDVHVHDTVEQLRTDFPSGKFVCPNCKGISTDCSTCNSGLIVDNGIANNGLPCDWKAWGLFRTMGRGYRFVVKEEFLNRPVVHEVFMPLELSGEKELSEEKEVP